LQQDKETFRQRLSFSIYCAAVCYRLSESVKKKKKTPWGRVLLEYLTVTQLVKKFPALYGSWRFITVFTSAHHWFLFWDRCILHPVHTFVSHLP